MSTPVQPSSSRTSLVTQRDLARTLNLDQSTVSRALRDSASVPTAKRRAIQAAAARLGYRTNAMASALVNLRHRQGAPGAVRAAIGWINTTNPPEDLRRKYPEFNLYWVGAQRAADKFGYRLEELAANEQTPLPRIERILHARGVQGVLLPPEPHPPTDWTHIHLADFFVVRLSRSVQAPNVHLVMPDQTANAILAFQEMRARGYEKIGYVGTPLTPERLFASGYLCAQAQLPSRLRLPPLYLPPTKTAHHAPTVAAWLKRHNPDAILEDVPGLNEILSHLGVRIPQDLGLATLNVRAQARVAGIDQNLEEVGRVGVLMLISLIHDGARGPAAIVRQNLVSGCWRDGATLPPRQ